MLYEVITSRDVSGMNPNAEGEGGQDRELVRRVCAIDVQGRVGFGITLCLSLGQGGFEDHALIGDLGKDVIASAVEDADHGTA